MNRPKEKAAPGEKGGFSNTHQAGKLDKRSVRQDCDTPARWEYRVAYTRADWGGNTHPKTRTFDRQADALRFVDRLESGDRVDEFSPARVTLSRRTVGAWREVVR